MKKYNMNELRNSDIFSHIPQMSYLPRWGVLLMDVMLCSIAFWISVWVGSGFLNYVNLDKQIVPIGSQYLIVMVVQVIAFWVFHTYSGILRYSTFIDTIKVLLSNVSTGLLLFLINLMSSAGAGKTTRDTGAQSGESPCDDLRYAGCRNSDCQDASFGRKYPVSSAGIYCGT